MFDKIHKTNTDWDLKDYALHYASMNLPVFPCKPNKTPLTNNGFKNATIDQAIIRKWWAQYPNASIGTPTGPGFFVLDVDLPDGPKTLGVLELENEPLPATLEQRTGSGGRHLFFLVDSEIRNSAGKLGKNIDIRGDGGYIILPPSNHESGDSYQWVNKTPIAKAPDWLIEKLNRPKEREHTPTAAPGKYGQKALAAELAELTGTGEGSRNHRLNQAAFSLGQLVAGGELDHGQVEAALSSAAASIGLSTQETRQTIKSGLEAGMRKPRTAPEQQLKAAPEKLLPVMAVQAESISVPIPLPDDLLPVEQFDYDLLPTSVRPWVADICDRLQCPPDFVAVAVMAAIGSLIGRKVGIRPQAKTDWTITANQWALVVGRPGVLKSPALEQALAPLKKLAAEANATYAEEVEEFQSALMETKLRADSAAAEAKKKLRTDLNASIADLLNQVNSPEEPTLVRYTANDTTPAALGELLIQNNNGLLIYRDELVSLLKSLDRDDQAEGRGFYLTGWNGDSGYTFDRIGRGMNLHIPAVCLSLLGGTQPGKLSEYVYHAVNGGDGDDGLLQRFGLLVWPDTNGEWKDVDRWPDTEAKREAYEVFNRLATLDPADVEAQQDKDANDNPEGMPYLRFDSDALKLFLEWRTNLEQRLRSGDLHPALESHFAKYRKLIPGLALIIHLAEDNAGPVTEQATLQALAWGDYLESHAQRAYGSTTQPEVMAAKEILKRIRKQDLKQEFSSRDVSRPKWSRLNDSKQVKSAIELLLDHNYLSEEIRTDTGGRPATIYHVNKGAA